MSKTLTREELYELVWSKPKTALAKEFGLSDVALGKTCAAARVPVPPRGYWAAHAAGKPVRRLPLSRRGLGESGSVEIGRRTGWYYDEPIGELPPRPEFSEPLEVVIERARKQAGSAALPRSLANPHAHIARLLAEDEERRKQAETQRYPIHSPKFDTPAAKRRLRLINAIFVGLSRASCRPSCRGDEAEELLVVVGDQVVAFSVMPIKRSRRNDRIFGPDDTKARLPLRIAVTAPQEYSGSLTSEWKDSETKPLEDDLHEIVVHLLVFGELLYRAGTLRHYEWLAERKRSRDEAERAARERAEQERREALWRKEAERRDRLISDAQNWRRAAEIRAFVLAIRNHPEAAHHPEKLERWVTWALSQADAMDVTCGPLSRLLSGQDEMNSKAPDPAT